MKMRIAALAICVLSAHLLQLAVGDEYRASHQCPDLELISLGRVMPHRDDTDYTPPVIGDVATYSCVQGYRVVGNVTRTCILTVNGTTTWDGTEPHCEILNCGDPGVPLHGRRRGKEFIYGEKVWFSCHNRTTLVGAETIICNEHGQWSNPRPICRKYGLEGYCPTILSIKNGRTVGGTKVGESLWFICHHGYTMIGPSSVRCQFNATWSNRPPVCVSICTDPPVIANGTADATYAAVNETITYSCDACHEMEELVEVKCLPNKTWSRPLPHCKRITCANPMDTVTGKRNHQFYCGAEMVFQCEQGYRIVGSNRLLCMENGNWSNHMPICEYAPEIGNCPELIPPINGSIEYSINDTYYVIAEYSCNTGYTLNGNAMRLCNDTGVWDGTAPSCVDNDASKCPFLDAPTNGFVVIGGFLHGDNATYFCNTDYILMSGDHVRQCMTNGRWSGNAPSCQKIEPSCLKPDDLLNAQYTVALPISTTINSNQLHHNVVVMGSIIRNTSNITGTDETALMFLLGSVAHYSCDDGYVMTGSNTLMCFSNGSWIGDIGTCETLKCPRPQEHEHSYVIPSGDLSIGSTATYHCYDGYFPNVMTISCQETGVWTELDARCSPAVCEYPDVKDDVVVNGNGFAYASKGIRLKCASSQARQTRRNARSKCQSNSTWSVTNFTCSGGLCPVDINFELCNSTGFAFIGTVNVIKKSNLLVTVERMLYQDLPGQEGQLKIFLSNPPLPNTQTCCKRMTVNSTYIFAGNYQINNNRVKLITNGCRMVYRLSGMDNAMFDVQNVDHSFLEQCQFRILASNS